MSKNNIFVISIGLLVVALILAMGAYKYIGTQAFVGIGDSYTPIDTTETNQTCMNLTNPTISHSCISDNLEWIDYSDNHTWSVSGAPTELTLSGIGTDVTGAGPLYVYLRKINYDISPWNIRFTFSGQAPAGIIDIGSEDGGGLVFYTLTNKSTFSSFFDLVRDTNGTTTVYVDGVSQYIYPNPPPHEYLKFSLNSFGAPVTLHVTNLRYSIGQTNISCPANSTYDVTTGMCINCQTGSTYNNVTKNCDCDPGYYSEEGKCLLVPKSGGGGGGYTPPPNITAVLPSANLTQMVPAGPAWLLWLGGLSFVQFAAFVLLPLFFLLVYLFKKKKEWLYRQKEGALVGFTFALAFLVINSRLFSIPYLGEAPKMLIIFIPAWMVWTLILITFTIGGMFIDAVYQPKK